MAKKKPTKKKAAAKNSPVAFESSLEALKEILSDLEEGNLPLSESLEKYEAGVKHLRNCHLSLQEAKAKIELLTGIDKDGNAKTKPFEHSATLDEESNEDQVEPEDQEEPEEDLEEDLAEEEDWDGGLF